MKPNQIFLMRHVQSEANADHGLYGSVPDWKIGITDKGRRQSIGAARILGAGIVSKRVMAYVSPYWRTQETYRHVVNNLGGFEFDLRLDPRLREQERGNLRVTDPDEWDRIERERDNYGTFFYRFSGGESGADVYDRCTGFLDTLFRDFDKPDFPATVLIVTHGYTLRVLLMRWFHVPVQTFHQWKCPKNGQVFQMVRQPNDKYQLTEPYPLKAEVDPMG